MDTKSHEICENEMGKYVKSWEYTKINTKGKMPLASLEEMESNGTTISNDGDRVSNLSREGKMLQLFKNIFYMFK
jgi:hypothetical protein